MEFSFDIRGYLKPSGKNKSNLVDFRENLVEPFEEDSSRIKLYEGFLKYNEELKAVLQGQKYQ